MLFFESIGVNKKYKSAVVPVITIHIDLCLDY